VRTLEPFDRFDITGRGRVWVTLEPDPPFELGEMVELEGEPRRIVGLERHPIGGGPRPGLRIGVMLR
jgi:hypothetical protein